MYPDLFNDPTTTIISLNNLDLYWGLDYNKVKIGVDSHVEYEKNEYNPSDKFSLQTLAGEEEYSTTINVQESPQID